MNRFQLNLSTHPFKAYKALNLGLLVLLLGLAAVTAQQVYSYQQFSALNDSVRPEEQKLREESDLLTRQHQELNSRMQSSGATQKQTEIAFLNELLLRKRFSWTRVFANLEQIMPERVHLLSLRPFLDEDGSTYLNINIRGRSLADANGFLRLLEDSEIFTDVVLAVETRDTLANGEVEFVLSTRYVPESSSGGAE
jgi:Tfp pilus assembly protein PilN